MTIGIEKYTQLITGLKQIADDTADARYDYFEKGFGQLKQGINPIIQEWREYCKKMAARYNIFKILDVERYENRHSGFLADLLNPRGSHDQGRIFLEKFIDLLLEKHACIPENTVEKYNPIIITEKSIATEDKKGRIDIHIEFAKKFAIIIENKIGSGDSWRQLQKYLEAQFTEFILIYLTPNRRDPSEDSLEKSVREQLRSEHKFICLSYGDIARWLEECLKPDIPQRLQEILDMYISVIRELSRTEEEDEPGAMQEEDF